MTEFEIARLILWDTFLSAMVIPFKTEYVFEVILAFGGHNNQLMGIAAAIGGTAGAIVGWVVGKVVAVLEKSPMLKIPEDNLQKAISILNSKLWWVMLFPWVAYVGNPLTVIAGFLRMPFKKFVGLAFAGNLIYYMGIILRSY